MGVTGLAIGRNIKTFRKIKKLSCIYLARVIGVSSASVRNWEHGRSSIRTERIKPLCRVLGISPNELFSWGDK